MTTSSILAAAIAQRIEGMAQTLDYQGTDLQDLIPSTPNPGGDSRDFTVHFGGNSSSTSYVEGETLPAAGSELYATATVSYSGAHIATKYEYSKIARDYVVNGNFDAIGKELEGALQAHSHAVESSLVTDIEAAIDSAGSYGGLLRATYNLASYEDSIGTLALSNLQTMFGTLTADPIGAIRQGMVICATRTGINAFLDVAAGVAYREFNPSMLPGVMQGGKEHLVPYYAEVPILEVKTMTSGTLLTFNPTDVERIVIRPVEVTLVSETNDKMVFEITSAQRIVVTNPRKCGKLTDI